MKAEAGQAPLEVQSHAWEVPPEAELKAHAEQLAIWDSQEEAEREALEAQLEADRAGQGGAQADLEALEARLEVWKAREEVGQATLDAVMELELDQASLEAQYEVWKAQGEAELGLDD